MVAAPAWLVRFWPDHYLWQNIQLHNLIIVWVCSYGHMCCPSVAAVTTTTTHTFNASTILLFPQDAIGVLTGDVDIILYRSQNLERFYILAHAMHPIFYIPHVQVSWSPELDSAWSHSFSLEKAWLHEAKLDHSKVASAAPVTSSKLSHVTIFSVPESRDTS